jgi:hypothetical protein
LAQLALFLNGVILPGGISGTDNGGAGGVYDQVIFLAEAGSTLTLVNSISTAGIITLPPMTGGSQNNVNASVYISRIL